MKKKKKFLNRTICGLLSIFICVIGVACMAGITYLIYLPQSRIPIITFIVIAWIYAIWELCHTQATPEKIEKEAS